MKYTEIYNLKKPEPTDFYNIADFNDNADKIDSALAATGNGWEAVALADFADMVNLVSSGDQWTASVWYNAALKVVKAHFNFTQIAVDYNTGDVIGTIKTAYLPKFTQYGQTMIWSSNKEILRPAVVTADGALSIGKAYDSAMPEVIDNLYFLDIAYVTA